MCELFSKVVWLQNEHLPLYKNEYNGTLFLSSMALSSTKINISTIQLLYSFVNNNQFIKVILFLVKVNLGPSILFTKRCEPFLYVIPTYILHSLIVYILYSQFLVNFITHKGAPLQYFTNDVTFQRCNAHPTVWKVISTHWRWQNVPLSITDMFVKDN